MKHEMAVASVQTGIDEINSVKYRERIKEKQGKNVPISSKFLAPMTDYEIRKMQGKNYEVNWAPDDLDGMKEIRKLSKVTRRLTQNFQDSHNRKMQLRHLNKEGENSPMKNVINQIKDA